MIPESGLKGERRIEPPPGDRRSLPFAVFLELERAARAARTRDELGYLVVNDTRRLVGFRVAAMLRFGAAGKARMQSATGVSFPDPYVPFTVFVERLATRLAGSGRHATSAAISRDGLSPEDLREWAELAPPHLLWTPMKRGEDVIGGIIYGSDAPFKPAEVVLADQIADAYGHAELALPGGRRRGVRWPRARRFILPAVIVLVLALLALPVRQAALAPAEVVGASPVLVTAPADGVVESLAVAPGAHVAAGALLFRLDDTNARAQRDIAERAVALAEAELRRAAQSAFADREATAQLDALRAQVQLKRAEYAYASEILERGAVRAQAEGVVVMGDPAQWIGRPVRTGERVMEIVDLARAEIRADVPIGQVFAFAQDANVALFLDTRPLDPLPATLVRMSYEAEMSPTGVLAHRAVARFDEGARLPRIGARGTARIEGARVPLALYLFGRPISAARQFFGL
jgi:hypothetical protein